MPGPSTDPLGNVSYIFAFRVSVPAGSALAAGTQERTYTVPGLLVGDIVTVNKPTFQNTISIGGARVSAANTLAINFVVSSGTPTLTAEDYFITAVRPDVPNVTQLQQGLSQ